jgi:hypothetical protein
MAWNKVFHPMELLAKSILTMSKGRLRFGNTQINLVFRSICTTFAP